MSHKTITGYSLGHLSKSRCCLRMQNLKGLLEFSQQWLRTQKHRTSRMKNSGPTWHQRVLHPMSTRVCPVTVGFKHLQEPNPAWTYRQQEARSQFVSCQAAPKLQTFQKANRHIQVMSKKELYSSTDFLSAKTPAHRLWVQSNADAGLLTAACSPLALSVHPQMWHHQGWLQQTWRL